MANLAQYLLSDLSVNQIKREFDKDVRKTIKEKSYLRGALVKSKELEEENKIFKSKAFPSAMNRYDKSLQYMCVAMPNNEDDANLMEEHEISIH